MFFQRSVMPALLFVLFAHALGAQRVSVQVRDGATNRPIPFVNLYFSATPGGVLTDEQGRAILDLSHFPADTVVRVSSLNYADRTVTVSALRDANGTYVLQLSPVTYDLGVVAIAGERVNYRSYRTGVKSRGTAFFDYSLASHTGREVGTIMRVRDRSRLEKIVVMLGEIQPDSFLIEINIYDYQWQTVGRLLQRDRLFRTITNAMSFGALEVDLAEQNTWVDGDFFVAVKSLRPPGNEAGAAFLNARTSTGRGLGRRYGQLWEDSYIYPAITAYLQRPR